MAAALVGGALLSASLQLLFDRLASREVLNFFHAKGLNEKLLDRLKTTFYAAGVVLDAAEYEQFSNPSVKRWLEDLQDVVYHTDDLFDEISTEAATQKEVPNYFSRLLNLNDRKMRNKIEEITDRLESIVKHKDILDLKKKVGENLSWRPQSSWRPPTSSLVEESDVYGRNEAKDSLIKILLDDKDDDSTPSVISIVGMGGIGKTTLAQLVYNDDKVKEKFNLKAWVCVSNEFDILKITKTTLKAITAGSCDMEGLDLLQLELKRKLSGKKFLIVLDDVWNEDYVQWDLLQKPFLHGAKGSKILLTTRSNKVASVVQINSTYTHHVGQLSEEDSWLLFAKNAFHSPDGAMSSSLEKIGRDIVKKCKGLPLALKALGGLLRSKSDIKDWNIILKCDLWGLPENECKIFPALRISYLYLPPHLKQCFAYCSLFPKGHQFSKKELILLWMAEGLLQSSNNEMSMEEVGHVNFDDLISRSFFQQSTILKGCFLMHDLIHDLSIFCAGEFCHRFGMGHAIEIPKRTRHLSYDARNATVQDIQALCAGKAESLRSLIVHFDGINHEIKAEDVDRLLLKFKRLRVLSLVGFQGRVLPDSIGQLIFLRYLDLSFSQITKLPASICKLFNLQTLKLRDHTMLPKGINKVKNLRFLSEFMVSKDEGADIGELGGLSNIIKLPKIRCLGNVRSSKEASDARMMDKKFIEELGLYYEDDVVNDLETEEDILDKLQPHLNLKVLTINGYRGIGFPDWLGHPSYHNIVDITLWRCNNCFILPPLGQLPSLKNLVIGKFDKLVNVGAEFYKTNDSLLMSPFPSLEFLWISDMPVLQEWSCIEIRAFPKIQYVMFKECPELVRCCISAKRMEFIYCLKLEFPKQQCYDSLELLITADCESVSSFAVDTFPNLKELKIKQEYEPGSFMCLLKDGCFLKDGLLPPCLSSLTLSNLWDLETFNLEAFQHLTSLQQLDINCCPNLKKSEVERLAALVTKINIYYCGISPEEVQHLSNVDVLKW